MPSTSQDWTSITYDSPPPIHTLLYQTPPHASTFRPRARPPVGLSGLNIELASVSFQSSSSVEQDEVFDHSSFDKSCFPLTPEITPPAIHTDKWQLSQMQSQDMTPAPIKTRSDTFQFGIPSTRSSAYSSRNASPEKGVASSQVQQRLVTALQQSGLFEDDEKKDRSSLPLHSKSTLSLSRAFIPKRQAVFALVLFVFSVVTIRSFLATPRRKYNTTLVKPVFHHVNVARSILNEDHADSPFLRTPAEIEMEKIIFQQKAAHGDETWLPEVDGHGGLHLFDEDEDELIAEDDLYYDSLDVHSDSRGTRSHLHDDDSRGAFAGLSSLDDRNRRIRPADRFDGMSDEAAEELMVIESRNKVSSLKALTAFIAAGGELPEDWTSQEANDMGQTPLEAIVDQAWKKGAGEGLQEALEDVATPAILAKAFGANWSTKLEGSKRLVVFSKSYCPYSQMAKDILQSYHIIPAPYIVELDQREDGPIIQSLLEEFTARRTVPNILLNWQPIGGADELQLAASEGSLTRILNEGGLRTLRSRSF